MRAKKEGRACASAQLNVGSQSKKLTRESQDREDRVEDLCIIFKEVAAAAASLSTQVHVYHSLMMRTIRQMYWCKRRHVCDDISSADAGDGDDEHADDDDGKEQTEEQQSPDHMQ